MNKNNNIINFYLLANKLKEKVRQGWIEMNISKERLESVAEHIYGCLNLAIAIDSEYKLDLDMYKVLRMLTLHEIEEILMGDLTIRSITPIDNKIEFGKKCVHEVVKDLIDAKEIEKLLDEFQGAFSYERAREDLPFYGARADEIDKKSKTASDFWIEYDRPKYDDDEIFKNLISDIKNIKGLK